MRRPKYPLEPLAELRDTIVDQAMNGVAAAARALALAEQKRRVAEEGRSAHAARVERIRRTEAEALERGELCVAHLGHADAWETRVMAEDSALAADVDRARGEESTARAAERRARDALAAREADARVVANDRARWDGAMQRAAETRDEEASLEAWRPVKS